ncbi:hypothetical protein BC939DRAFT_510827 [Gamsiella multidivaricata]|uniref:uncharacterized protein n=1 Tax=Gamsiella multidivaricata TaxID=101098 RepID=UPI00221F6C86|nr:uncharacterized protein BC939DRAFT_510827 [Gamsiella multidivaricata]KAI7828967.1 hypothetical protein BC939DRAFT_510827 [Gamsiella multidivaricata]
MVVSYLVIGSIVSYKRLSLPTPKSVEDASGPDDFSAKWAWKHLEEIAQRPHPINSRENLRIHDYLAKTVRDLQEEARQLNRTVELADDNVKLTLARNFLSNSTRLDLKGHPEAVVVSAHYDSVLIGHGATDDGIGVSVCLEMIRNLIHHPVKHNVIFNINNGEEVGLFGAAAFMKHPWAKDVKAFINLEGAGAGGRALLFRASNKALAKFYSKVGNSPHANVFGNDIFKIGLIKSGTDFSVYTAYNIPGLDIAFYSRRAFYHTLHDDLEHTSPASVQHMGNTGLTAMRNIADSDYLIKPKEILSQESSIYYDIAGLFMLVYSFNTYLTLNYNLIIIVPIFIAYSIVSSRKHGLTLGVVLRSYIAMILSFVAAIAVSIGFAALLNKINPMLVYGEHWLGFMFFIFQCCTTIICVQWGWVLLELWLKGDMGPDDIVLERIRVDSEQVANVGMVLFWWTLLIAATVIGQKKEIGLFYFLTWFTVTSMISAHLSVYPRRRGTSWTLARLWINFVPLMMVLDIAITNMIAMGQTLVDGTPPFAIMALFALCALNCVMPLIPTIHRSANFRKMGQVSVFLTVALLISACIVFPYSAEEAPNKLVWRQVYDLNHNTSLVTVKTMNRLETIMDLVPAAEKRECGPDPVSNNALTQCIYEGAVPRLVIESRKSGEEIIKSEVSKPEHHHDAISLGEEIEAESKSWFRVVHLKWTAKDSRLCQVNFPTNSSIVVMKLDGFDEPDQGYIATSVKAASRSGMVSFKRKYDQVWDLEVVYRVEDKDAPALEGTLGCLYDEWDQEQIPAFTNMRSHLPKWALLGGGKGPGLLTIQKKVHV